MSFERHIRYAFWFCLCLFFCTTRIFYFSDNHLVIEPVQNPLFDSVLRVPCVTLSRYTFPLLNSIRRHWFTLMRPFLCFKRYRHRHSAFYLALFVHVSMRGFSAFENRSPCYHNGWNFNIYFFISIYMMIFIKLNLLIRLCNIHIFCILSVSQTGFYRTCQRIAIQRIICLSLSTVAACIRSLQFRK